MKFLTATERAKQPRSLNILLHGASGSGKTTQAQGLPPESSLLIDFEAGTAALADWKGPILDINKQAQELDCHPWALAQAMASLCSGPDMAVQPEATYGKAYYDKVVTMFPAMVEGLKNIDTIFLDSLSDATRTCYSYCEQQPYAISAKSGKPDGLAVYGGLGKEMIAFAKRMQHSSKDLVAAVILDKDTDEFQRPIFTPQMMGSVTKNTLIGIFDIALTIHNEEDADGLVNRSFITGTPNKWGYPAKDRTRGLDLVEAFSDGDTDALWRLMVKAKAALKGGK